MELINQPLSCAIVAESLSLSKTPVAEDDVTDKCNPVFQLQGQLEMKLVSICLTVRLLEKGETELKLREELEELRHGKQASQQPTCSRLLFRSVQIE